MFPPNGEKIIDSYLEIQPGATLTIQSDVTVRFGRKSKVVIKPGGKLILNGTLTSKDLPGFINEPWKGVEVWGNREQHQYLIGGQYYQGYFKSNPGAVIENAEVGLQLWGPHKIFYNDFCEGSLEPGTGGIAECNGTNFHNNRLGVDIRSYSNFSPVDQQPRPYRATFYDCDFTTDITYPHTENMTAFVNIYFADGPRFKICDFNSNYTPPQVTSSRHDYGFGILASNSTFSVTGTCPIPIRPCPTDYLRSTFSGLGYGISTAPSSSSFKPFRVQHCDFSNCYVGLQNLGVGDGVVLFNEFYLGQVPNSNVSSAQQVGIYNANTILGMVIEENKFLPQNSPQTLVTTGISCHNIGAFSNTIRSNEFDDLNIGNGASGICADDDSGLQYECNTNTNVTTHDFLICSDEGNSRIGNPQGFLDEDLNPIATGNTFSNTSLSASGDFNNTETANPIDYHHKINGGTAEIPDQYAGLDELVPSDPNPCDINYTEGFTEPGDASLQKSAFYNHRSGRAIAKTNYEAAIAANNTSLAAQYAREMAQHRRGMDANGLEVMRFNALDTLTWHRDTVRTWLSNIERYPTEVMLALDYLEDADKARADSVLTNIPGKFALQPEQVTDLAYIDSLFDIFSVPFPRLLSADERIRLTDIADQETVIASNIAKSLLSETTNAHDLKLCYDPGIWGGASEYKQKQATVYPTDKIRVYPNPSDQTVVFGILSENTVVQIIDVKGRLLWQKEADRAERLVWNNSGHPEGIYFYRILSNGASIQDGKLVIQR